MTYKTRYINDVLRIENLAWTISAGSAGPLPDWTPIAAGTTLLSVGAEGIISCGGYNSSFEQKRRGRRLVTGDMSVYITRTSFKRGRAAQGVRKNSGGQRLYYRDSNGFAGLIPISPPPLESSWDTLVANAQSKAAKRILDRYNEVRLTLTAAVAAEAGKSAELLVDYVKQASNLFRGSYERIRRKTLRELRAIEKIKNREQRRRRRRHSGQRLVDFASREWLKLNFGLAPLYGDLDAIAKSSRDMGDSRRPEKLRAVETVDTVTVASDFTSPSMGYGVRFNNVRTVTDRARIKYLTILALTGGYGGNLEARGLGLRDAVATIWELMPWSWLVDYVSNAGDVLDSLAQFTGIPATTQTTVVRQRIDENTTSKAFFTPSGRTVITIPEFSPSKYKRELTAISRSIADGVPLIPFTIENNLTEFRLSMVLSVAWTKLAGNRLNKLVGRLMSTG